MRTFITLALLCTLVACGGGGDSDPGAAPAPADHVPAASLAIIGNSITFVPRTPGLWEHDGGMAASDADHDYAHLVARGMSIASPLITNFADLERNPADAINKIDTATPVKEQIATVTAGIDAKTAVVIQLGDNAAPADLAQFGAAYAALLDAASARLALVCVSTFWEHTGKDAVIKAACEAHGGSYVYIGDIFRDPANRDLLDGPQYANATVKAHPHDWSMARIAERVLSALLA